MASLIDPDVPASPNAYTADLRANFAAAKSEIEDLQSALDALGPGGPLDCLPLTGGTLSGALHLPNGTLAAPGLGFGPDDGTGLSRTATALIVGAQNTMMVAFIGGPIPAAQFYTPVYLLNNRLMLVGDATAASDGLNMRTGDARYAPVTLVQQVAELRSELDRLRHLLQRREVSPPVGVGMRTEILAPPA